MTGGHRAAFAAAALLAVVVGLLSIAGREAGSAGVPMGLGPQGRIPQFVVECPWSHSAADDPIVHPGHAGAGHVHDFFGNTSTDATSTYSSLLVGATTCENRLDTAAYWAPALYDRGALVRPLRSVAYYQAAPGVEPAAIVPFPAGLVMIGGNPDATLDVPQPVARAGWHCGASPRLASAPPECPRTATLGMRVAFPSCWDGHHLDSADHRSHVAIREDGRCPAGHPVPIPQLIFEIHYPIHGPGHVLELASGGVHTMHADFVNAWDQTALEREVRACLNRAKVCGIVSDRATG